MRPRKTYYNFGATLSRSGHLHYISCLMSYYCLLRSYAADTGTSNDSSVTTGIISSRIWRESISANIARPSRLICVQPHQRINLTLVDFSVDDPTASVARMQVRRQPTSSDAVHCSDPLIAISEANDVENKTVICGGQRRHSSVYLSTSNCVHVLLNATATRSAEFLVYYEGMQLSTKRLLVSC